MRASDIKPKRQEAFWKRLDKRSDGCWVWTGYVSNTRVGNKGMSYGRISLNNRNHYTHRIAYILTKGDIPKGLVVRHMCNNSLCCNPDHLELGTFYDNSEDKMKAGRQAKGCSNGRSKLNERQVAYMRNSKRSHSYFSRLFSVGNNTIRKARFGDTWTHLNDMYPPRPEIYNYYGLYHYG